jgi:hypothetical protein
MTSTEERGSQGDQFVKLHQSTGQIIMEEAKVVEGVVDTPPESQPAFGGSLWHKTSCM